MSNAGNQSPENSQVFQARLDGALSNLGWWKMFLLMAGGLEPDIFKVPSNPNHSMILIPEYFHTHILPKCPLQNTYPQYQHAPNSCQTSNRPMECLEVSDCVREIFCLLPSLLNMGKVMASSSSFLPKEEPFLSKVALLLPLVLSGS